VLVRSLYVEDLLENKEEEGSLLVD
jgi:hypothetical protein